LTTTPPTSTAVGPPGPGLRRNVRGLEIMQVSIGSIIGSGWLFGSLFAAQIAGPAAMITWLIGGAAMIVLALVHAELGSMYPVAGGSARFAYYAFGNTGGFTIGWFAWISGAATAPIEVEAALQYATNYVPWLTHSVSGVTVLQPAGYAVALGCSRCSPCSTCSRSASSPGSTTWSPGGS
jgi:amino acid transporter